MNNNKYTDALGLTDKDFEKIVFPILIWSELDGRSQVVILANKDNPKVIFEDSKGGIVEFINGLSEGSDSDTFFADAILGDETQNIFKLVDFQHESIDWDSLIKEYNNKANKLPYAENDFEKAIVDELNNNYVLDLKASAIESYYNSIVANMVDAAAELGIETLAFIGPIVYQEKFRQIAHKHLNENYTVILGN